MSVQAGTREKMTMAGKAVANGQRRRGVFDVDEDRAPAELGRAWADGGYPGVSADGRPWGASRSAGGVLTRGTVGERNPGDRRAWPGVQGVPGRTGRPRAPAA